MLGNIGAVVLGVILLTLAADRFVLSAARLAKSWGASQILIGALILGMGTSAPELLIGSLAAAQGELDAAIGAVIGSNVANLTLVLGATALVWPLAGAVRTIRREGILMMAAVTILAVLVWNLELTRLEGAGLLIGMVLASLLLIRWARADAAAGNLPGGEATDVSLKLGRFGSVGESLIGLAALALTLAGAALLLNGGVGLAEDFGVSSGFIGLTVLAIGTSLPELATGVAAARRRQNNLVVGNLLGSNLFNSLAVAGAAALIGPGPLAENFRPELVYMVGIAAGAGALSATGNILSRVEGLVLLAGYGAFIVLV